MKAGEEIKAKKACCQSSPRCKRCPKAIRKLEQKGLAERIGKRRYVIDGSARKRDLKKARKR